MTDIVEYLEKFGSNWPYDAALAEIKSLRQQLAVAAKTCAEMLSEQDYEYNRKTNAIIERHVKQLAEFQAREDYYRAALEMYIMPMPDKDTTVMDILLASTEAAMEALAMPSDSAALDTMLKQAKREQAEKCFDRALLKSNGHGVPGILEELRYMAKELE